MNRFTSQVMEYLKKNTTQLTVRVDDYVKWSVGLLELKQVEAFVDSTHFEVSYKGLRIGHINSRDSVEVELFLQEALNNETQKTLREFLDTKF